MVFSSTCESTRMPPSSNPIPSRPVQNTVSPIRQNGNDSSAEPTRDGPACFPVVPFRCHNLVTPLPVVLERNNAAAPQPQFTAASHSRLARKPAAGMSTNTVPSVPNTAPNVLAAYSAPRHRPSALDGE